MSCCSCFRCLPSRGKLGPSSHSQRNELSCAPGVQDRAHAPTPALLDAKLCAGGRSPASPRWSTGGGLVAEKGAPGPTRHDYHARSRCAPLQRPPPDDLELSPQGVRCCGATRRVGGLPVRIFAREKKSRDRTRRARPRARKTAEIKNSSSPPYRRPCPPPRRSQLGAASL